MALCLAVSTLVPVSAMTVDSKDLKSVIDDTGAYIYKTTAKPEMGSIGGEWAVLGLARAEHPVSDSYYSEYYRGIEKYVKERNGVLHDKKYTEYSRLIIALTAIGKDPRNVAGYDLTKALGDYDKTIWQGLNGPIWALIALDSGNYPVPSNSEAQKQATRQMYVDRILACQLSDGGWSLFGGTEAGKGEHMNSDPDITGMALQALAKYQDQPAVKKATAEALNTMSKMQMEDGGFSSWGTANSESAVQVLVALNELGVPVDDKRFVKNGNTILDYIMKYYVKGKGFLHTLDGSGSNQMATEQAFYGLISAYRAEQGKSSLYRMSDVKVKKEQAVMPDNSTKSGLPGKNQDVKGAGAKTQNISFSDMSSHKNKKAVEELASRGIINGMGNGEFCPDNTMTRAEFATIVVKSLGLVPTATKEFSDVSADKWYAGYVGTASKYGIVSGVGDGKFNPAGTITKQEAAAMITRAAKLCGMDTERNQVAVRDTLAQFPDYVSVSEWARSSVAFCYSEDIFDQKDSNVLPKEKITRGEIAQTVYNLLGKSNLI